LRERASWRKNLLEFTTNRPLRLKVTKKHRTKKKKSKKEPKAPPEVKKRKMIEIHNEFWGKRTSATVAKWGHASDLRERIFLQKKRSF